MADPQHGQTPDVDDLSFEEATYDEVDQDGLSCAVCHGAIADHYYQVNQSVTCERCCVAVSEHMSGSGAKRFFLACLLGSIAGLLGAALWWGIRAATGYDLGLIALVVGLAVGFAVRRGASGKGGWLYRGVAMLITYIAVCASYVPMVLEGVQEGVAEEAAMFAQPQDEADPTGEGTATTSGTPMDTNGMVSPPFVLLVIIACAISLTVPFLLLFESPISALIVGLALYEAWKINAKMVLDITGPYAIAPPAAPILDPAETGGD